MWGTNNMTTVNSEQKYDQSVYQDFILRDDVLTTINSGVDGEGENSYAGYVELYEGDKKILEESMDFREDGAAYELRLESSQVAALFKPGKKYVMYVYEKNDIIDYKMYVHKETIKILA